MDERILYKFESVPLGASHPSLAMRDCSYNMMHIDLCTQHKLSSLDTKFSKPFTGVVTPTFFKNQKKKKASERSTEKFLPILYTDANIEIKRLLGGPH